MHEHQSLRRQLAGKKVELETKQVTGYKSGKDKLAYSTAQTTDATLQ